MAGLGLENAYGADAAAERLRQLILDRQQRDLQQSQIGLANRASDRADRSLDQQDELKRIQIEDLRANRAGVNRDREIGLASTLGDQLPPGATMAPTDPAVALLQQGGRGSLLEHQDPTLPSTQTAGAMTLPEPGGVIRGTARMTENAGNPEQFKKLASQKQIDTNTDNARQAQALKQTGENQDWKNTIAQQIADLKGGATAKEHFTPQDRFVEGKPVAGVMNTGTGEWKPLEGGGSFHAAPGAAQAAQHEQSRKEALDSLDQLDQSIDLAKDLIGPGSGRISNLQQMVGSQDPRINALGTKMLLAKMQVDHAATGTVRAGASPTLLARWDNILANKVTPEGLKAAVQAMREILGSGATPSGAGKPTADDLIKKYGGK